MDAAGEEGAHVAKVRRRVDVEGAAATHALVGHDAQRPPVHGVAIAHAQIRGAVKDLRGCTHKRALLITLKRDLKGCIIAL